MKSIKYILLFLCIVSLSGCKDWLTILPENEQTSDKYWKNKEEVEAVLMAGYVKLRNSVSQLFDWGELRGGSIYDKKSDILQAFRVKPTHNAICNWSTLYETINMANSVITYAPQVMVVDPTFEESVMKSYLAEAYFLRALSYFYLVRNFKEVPLITTPYVNDKESYEKAKSPEADIITQIKADISEALNSKAAKEFFSTEWETKGRATKWALHTLMADVCLWDEDYETAVMHCQVILDGSSKSPVFIKDPLEWFTMYYPGNSTESIFEVQWDMGVDAAQKNPLCDKVGTSNVNYYFTPWMLGRWLEESDSRIDDQTLGRGLYGSYVTDAEKNDGGESTEGYVWKYYGGGAHSADNARPRKDANFIVYRVADVMLMKAEALTLLGGMTYYKEALDIINQIRKRSSLPDVQIEEGEIDEASVLDIILTERTMEFAGEGKRWYDLLRFGKRNNYHYKWDFLIDKVAESTTAGSGWVRSVLLDNNAHYLPISTKEIEANPLLTQNPYYEIGK